MMTQRSMMLATIACVACIVVGCSREPEPAATAAAPAIPTSSEHAADLIIHGGPILSMEGDKPGYVEAVVVAQGKIAFAGSDVEAMKRKSASTVVKDLGGKTMLPGFVDAHSHFINAPTLSQQVNVSPSPVGVGDTVPQIVAALKEWQAKAKVPDGGWIQAWGYDDSMVKGGDAHEARSRRRVSQP